MPTREGYTEGVPAWVELTTADLEQSKTFYRHIFGWEYQDNDSDVGPYTIALRNGLAAAGIRPVGADQPGVWSTYFAVDDVDAAIEKVSSAGGSIVQDSMEVPGGKIATAADPTGAVFGMWESGDFAGAGIVDEHGTLNWTELMTNDLDSATVFYEHVFGHEVDQTRAEPAPYWVFSVGGRGIAGAMGSPNPNRPNAWSINFAVDDAHAAITTAMEAGGSKSYGPMEIAGVGKFAGLVDPFGAHFTVIELETDID